MSLLQEEIRTEISRYFTARYDFPKHILVPENQFKDEFGKKEVFVMPLTLGGESVEIPIFPGKVTGVTLVR
jgi:hypothetical protein